MTHEQVVLSETCPNCGSLNTIATRIDFRHQRGRRFCRCCGMDYAYEVDSTTKEVKREIIGRLSQEG